MNIRSPFNCTEIGKWLAHADDRQQAELLNAFAEELRISCGSNMDMQLCFMSNHVSPKAAEMLTTLNKYIKLRHDPTP